MTMTKTVLILNSPPGAGKDTLANLMVKEMGATHQEFKRTLYKRTSEHFNWDLSDLELIAKSRELKDTLYSDFSREYNITPREALIHVSEEVIKPKYGSAYFGEKAAESLAEGLNVFSDGGGWWEELEPVFGAADKTIICRLYRHGYTFENDSRQYYSSDLPKDVTRCDIHLEEGHPLSALDCIYQLLRIQNVKIIRNNSNNSTST
jgi:hypothetical protein